ncbi:MAG: hypothetical protein K0Q79_3176 [Flavipsychrobacter sp.]|jgi:gliding motility-associated-like protein|nr:hypothetical protein [Flavipsychrobacter sp.]
MQRSRWILSALFFALFTHIVQGQVVAGFNASPLSGCAPLVVSFTNTTSPSSGTTYVWNMGNGSGPITLRDPSTSYFTPGTYTVTLTATNGSSTSTATRVITVHPSPVVDFTASDTVMCPGTTVTFSNATTAGVPGPVTYLWSSGDGYTGTGASFSHAYSLPGYFNVSLNATNSAGCAALLTKHAYIHLWPPPVPTFSVTTRQVCPNTGAVRFTPSVSGAGPFTYQWYFGDGGSSTSSNPSHLYTSPGIYTVKLIATDSRGCTDSIVVPNYIKVSPLNAAFAGPDSACVNTFVNFTNISTGYSGSRWSYGDGGGFTTSTHGSHTYTRRGTYPVTLIVTDSFCSDTFVRNFLVPEPDISFKITPDSPCPAPVLATFKASVPGGSTVWWNFGDGSTGTGITTTHTYTQNETYIVTMIANSSLGCKDTANYEYIIMGRRKYFEYPPLFLHGGCLPFRYYLPRGVSLMGFLGTRDTGYIYPWSVVWDYGDGSAPGLIADHVYTAVGTYPVSVTFIFSNGCPEVLHDTIKVGTRPHAEFVATPRHLCYDSNIVYFTRTLISGPVDSIWYWWRFGDHPWGYDLWDTNTVVTYTVPYHFEVPDTMSDTLITYYNWCPDTFVRKDYVIIDSPKAKAELDVVSCPRTVHYYNISLGDDSHIWFFPDSTTSTLDSPVHTYARPGVYTTMLTAYNARSGCRDTTLIGVDLTVPVISFSASDTAICREDTVRLTATRLSGNPTSYRWVTPGGVNGGFLRSAQVPSVTETYRTPGRYPVKLLIYDQNMCTDSVVKNNYILVAKPNVHFRTTPTNPCWPQTTTFIDSSTDQPGVTFSSYRWSFGDGTSAISGSPSVPHTYTAEGTYTIKEIVTDNVGCKDSATLTRSLYESKAGFFAVSQACANTNVSFTNLSSTGTYLWSFGDGRTSTLANPTHAFAASGTYTVTLVVTETHGCKDTARSTISIAKPNASFYMDDSISVCPPLSVNFHNTSTGGVANFWIFGDGNTSVAVHPNNLYTLPGYDTVKLVVTNAAGCKDTAIGHVKVFGYAGAFSYNADSGCVPLQIRFNADLSNIALAASIIWDFSDGIVSSASLSDTISHFYTVPGAYLPKLIITDHAGCVSSSLGKDTIKVDGVRAGFLAIPDPVCLNDTIKMTDTSSSFWSYINKWHWDHNGDTSNLRSPYFIFSALGTHTVTLVATDGWGCSGTASQVLSVYALPGITSLPDSAVCVGGTTDLDNSTPGGIWTSGNTGIATVGTGTGFVTGVSAGIVMITYSLSSACFATMPVTVNAYPDAGDITGDTTLCVGETVLLADTVAGGVWHMGGSNATISAAGEVRGISAGNDTVYYIVTNVTCPDTAFKPVVVFPLPDSGVITGKDAICVDAVITLVETVPDGKWSSSAPGIAVIDSVTGLVRAVGIGTAIITYTVLADANGCTNFTTFPLRVINTDFSINSVVEHVKCYGDSTGSIAVTVNGGVPPFEFKWSVDSVTPSVTNLDTGAYTVNIRSTENQCKLSQTFEITEPDTIAMAAVTEDDICYRAKGSIAVSVTGGTSPYTYLWSNKETKSDINGLIAGSYSVTVTDANGCFKYNEVNIKDSCADILIRTALSPNGDGVNDTWIIEGIDKFPGNNVKLFDKWGDMIYEKDGYNNEWDGMHTKGYALPDGTYFYLVKLNSQYTASGKDVYTGAVLLKR